MYREKAISNTKIMKNPSMFSETFIKRHLFLFESYRSIILLCSRNNPKSLRTWGYDVSPEIFGKVAPRNFCVFLKPSLKNFSESYFGAAAYFLVRFKSKDFTPRTSNFTIGVLISQSCRIDLSALPMFSLSSLSLLSLSLSSTVI